MIPSRYNFSITKCHTVATRWLCEGLARSCSHRKTIGKHRMSIVLSSCGVKARCRWWPREVRRWLHEPTGCLHDGLTMATRWPRRTHEVHTTMHLREDLRQFFDMPKILWTLPKLLPNPKKLSQRSHDGLGCSTEWPDVFTIIPDVANFLNRVSIAS